jgi:hypothetical protein
MAKPAVKDFLGDFLGPLAIYINNLLRLVALDLFSPSDSPYQDHKP